MTTLDGMFAPLVTLRCQTVVDSFLAYVTMPIALEVWDSADETARDRIREYARKELWHAVAKRTGREMPHDCLDSLPVWEEHADRCEAECVGGPMDGTRIRLSTGEPPLSLVLPAPVPIEDLAASASATSELIPTLMYSPLKDEHGFLSRTTDGAWRYEAMKRAA